MKKTGWVLFAATLLVLFMFGVWLLDISASAIFVGRVVTNGFWEYDPVKSYHLGMYTMLFTFWAMFIFVIYHLEIDGRKNEM
jgi:hypothetical protein